MSKIVEVMLDNGFFLESSLEHSGYLGLQKSIS